MNKLASIAFQFSFYRKDKAPKKESSSAAVKVTREYLTWDERFTQLVDYKNEHGHCNPKRNTKLGLWCMNQRMAFKENKLRHNHMNKLASIAFQFKVKLGPTAKDDLRNSTSTSARVEPPMEMALNYTEV
jgi:hypothetical protein